MRSNKEKTFTDILYFDKKENKRVKRKDCEIISNFLLSKNDFFAVKSGNLYFICVSHDGELISLWHISHIDNGTKISPFEATSIFRKKYLSENVTQERLELFISNPLEYESKFPKTT